MAEPSIDPKLKATIRFRLTAAAHAIHQMELLAISMATEPENPAVIAEQLVGVLDDLTNLFGLIELHPEAREAPTEGNDD